jgi:hypothetical protein
MRAENWQRRVVSNKHHRHGFQIIELKMLAINSSAKINQPFYISINQLINKSTNQPINK